MNIVSEDLNFSHFRCMFFQMGNELSRSDFPDSDLSLLATGDDEFVVMAQGDCSHTILVSVINLPKLLVVIHSECADLSI